MYTTATIIQVDPPDIKGNIHVVVQYTGDNNEPGVNNDFYFNSTIDPVQLQTQVSNQVTNLNNLFTTKSNIVLGATILTTTPVVTPPTTLQADEAQFVKDWFRWQQINKAIAAGLLTGSEAQVSTFKSKMSNEFQQVITDAVNGGATTAQAWGIALNLL